MAAALAHCLKLSAPFCPAPDRRSSGCSPRAGAGQCAAWATRGLRVRAVWSVEKCAGAEEASEEGGSKGREGMTGADIPLLTAQQVLDNLRTKHRHGGTDSFRAMYSSVAGGITRDPAAMVLPLDDHMVHRGHGVFDTAIISSGQLYELDAHLDRLLRSAAQARIHSAFSREQLRHILISTAAASGVRDGELRYWLSVGPGGFSISPQECSQSSFYAIVRSRLHAMDKPSQGVKVITSSVPMKSAQMGTMKTVNYLPNALAHMEAEERGAFEAVWVDNEGFVAEAPTMNVAFVSKEGVLMVPSFDKILSGCTVQRVMQLAQPLVSSSPALPPSASHPSPLLHSIVVGPVRAAEARGAAEMMLFGSGTQVEPVVQWDGQAIGTGRPGPVALALRALLLQDYTSGPLVPIPYIT